MTEEIEKKELISIIIPIYNVEKYLNQCIKSIINQTYNNLEIILVDDGSTDSSSKICESYKEKDKRIKIIHKTNGGLSDARNKGIEAATGEYLAFVDSDDYIDKEFIELLYKELIKYNTDVAQCGVVKVDNEEKILEENGYIKEHTKTGKQIIEDMYKGYWNNIVVWNKLYKKELFSNIRFPVGKIHEDEFTTYKILYNIDKVAIVNKYLYKYRQNKNSIMGKNFTLKRLDILEALNERLLFFETKNEKQLYVLTLESYLKNIKFNYIKVNNIKVNNMPEDTKDVKDKLIKEYRKKYKKMEKCKEIAFKKKLKWFLFYISPNIYMKLKREELD